VIITNRTHYANLLLPCLITLGLTTTNPAAFIPRYK
jgi:hypothetical protein